MSQVRHLVRGGRLALLMAVVVALVSCGDDPEQPRKDESSPEAAFREHLETAVDGDCNRHVDTIYYGASQLGTSERDRDECQRYRGRAKLLDLKLGEMTDVEVPDSWPGVKAAVELNFSATYTEDGEEYVETDPEIMVQVDAVWLVLADDVDAP